MLNSIVKIIFFWYRVKILFLSKNGPKNKKYLSKINLGAKTERNMVNLMVTFICPVWNEIYIFLRKFVRKYRNCLFNLKVGTYTNSNRLVQRSWIWLFCSFVLSWGGKYDFLANLVQRIKTVCLRWKLVLD